MTCQGIEFMNRRCKLWRDWAEAVTLSFVAKVRHDGLELTVDVSFVRRRYGDPDFTLALAPDARVIPDQIREALGDWLLTGLGDSFVEEYEQAIVQVYGRYALTLHVMMMILSLTPVDVQREVVKSTRGVFSIEPKDVLSTARHGDLDEVRALLQAWSNVC